MFKRVLVFASFFWTPTTSTLAEFWGREEERERERVRRERRPCVFTHFFSLTLLSPHLHRLQRVNVVRVEEK